ncbi:hypothetical protein BDA99DRAFT_101272 [Phascolomyces articulosus]|uniref:Uncharacterized protein n=1 Tax=Phascolomyces articulosus TaxID=60185 RepID=A0AAD5K6P1_9FUNG|nr:hypothetical protein BDA99DRAFT_101272 [Phascolomyces articulosus]
MVEFFKEIRSSKPRDAQSEDQYFIDHAASLYVSKKRASDLNQLDKKRRNSYEKKGIKMVGITANKNELQNIANKSGVFDSLTGIQGCFSSKYDIKHQLSFDKKNSFVLDEDGKTMLPCAHSVENLVVRLRVFTMIRRNEDIAKLEAWISAIKNLSQEHIDNIIGTIYKTYLTLPDLLAKTNIQPPH